MELIRVRRCLRSWVLRQGLSSLPSWMRNLRRRDHWDGSMPRDRHDELDCCRFVAPSRFGRIEADASQAACNCINGVCASLISTATCACNAGWSKAANGTQCAACATGYFASASGDCLGQPLARSSPHCVT